jgi:hypothetical protein
MLAFPWWRPIDAAVSESTGRFRMAKAVFSISVWSFARRSSVNGGLSTRKKSVRRRWRELEKRNLA